MRSIFQTLIFCSFIQIVFGFSSASFGADPSGVNLPKTESFEIAAGEGHISFVAIGRPAMLRIHGESNSILAHLDWNKQTLNGEFSAPLKDFKTGIELRDEHMKKKYLEIDKYPLAVLKIQNLEISNLQNLKEGEIQEIKFKAALSLHGVTQDTNVTAKLSKKAGHFKVLSQLQIKLSDFKIEIPTYAGIKVADNVEIEVQFQTK